jgi:hypothetical protein
VLTEQAGDAIYKARNKAEKAALNEFSIKDYCNPQGQF